MKVGTWNHVKLKRLKRLLDTPLHVAAGVLEGLWHLAAECADEGDIGKFSNEEIADHLEWPGDPNDLMDSLLKSGWVDEDDGCRLKIHDWLEHCPDFIKERVRKRKAREIKTYGDKTRDKQPHVPPVSGDSPEMPPLVPSIPIQSKPIQSNKSQSKKPRPAVTVSEVQIPKELDTPEFRSALDEWLAYKRKRRESYQDAASVLKLLQQYVRAGPALFVSAVNHSIAQNYAGCYAPGKGNHDGKQLTAGQRYDPSASGDI